MKYGNPTLTENKLDTGRAARVEGLRPQLTKFPAAESWFEQLGFPAG
jgi:hypothetical protein